MAHVALLEQDLKVAQVHTCQFKHEVDLYSNGLSKLNDRFNTLENLKRAADVKTQSLQEQVGALENDLLT